jgi:hypothetical protein
MGLLRSVCVRVPLVIASTVLLLFGSGTAAQAGTQTEESGKAIVSLVKISGGVRLVVNLGSSAPKAPRDVVVVAGKHVYPLSRSAGAKKPSNTWLSAIQKGAKRSQLERLVGKPVKVKVIEQDGGRQILTAVVKGPRQDKPAPSSAAQPPAPPPVAGPNSPALPPEPPFGTLSATLNVPGPLVDAAKEQLRFRITADAESIGEAFIALPEPQPDPTFGTPDPFAIDFTPSPQVSNSGLPGYVSVGSSTCAMAAVKEVVPVKEVLPPGAPKPGIRVAYDCAAGQGFAVFYNPRISYWGFGSFPTLDSWKFTLSQRRNADQPWSPLPSDLGIQVGPTFIELNQNIFISPPAPIVASQEIANGQLKLVTQGYNAAGTKNESVFETGGYWTGNGEIIELKEGSAENLRSVEQAPLEVNGCIWDTVPNSELNVTGDDATDTIRATNLLLNGDVVIFNSKTGGSAIKAGQKYYVINRTPTSFQISTDDKTAANLGSDLKSPTTVARQTVTPPKNAPPLICEDIYVFGVIEMTPPPKTFTRGAEFWEAVEWIAVTNAQASTHAWIGASRECLAAGGNYTDVDGTTPGGTGKADWRCDFPASKGYTHDVLVSILHGWANEYGQQETCGYGYLFLEENYPSGGGADDIWCPLVTVGG